MLQTIRRMANGSMTRERIIAQSPKFTFIARMPEAAYLWSILPSDILPSAILLSDILLSDILLSDILPSDILPSDILPSDILPSDILPPDILPSDILLSDILLSDILLSAILLSAILPSAILPSAILPSAILLSVFRIATNERYANRPTQDCSHNHMPNFAHFFRPLLISAEDGVLKRPYTRPRRARLRSNSGGENHGKPSVFVA